MKKRKNANLTTKKKTTAPGIPAANRKYKDTVFRKLFSDRKNLLSLYNAINGTDYKNPEDLEIVTLDSAIYMGMKNDLAFIIDTGLFLFEHQSTYTPNMPLRDLFYVSGEFQKLVTQKSLYASTLQRLPAPNFIVFYNGSERTEDRWENFLSEAYENLSGEPQLELRVVTLNINKDHNPELMEQCQTLREYAIYVDRVRTYAKVMDLSTAVKKAIDECIQEGILEEFLRANRAEVIAMSIFEYDKEFEMKKLRQAEFDAGITVGALQKAKTTALSLEKMGLPASQIAQAVDVDLATVQQWLTRDVENS